MTSQRSPFKHSSEDHTPKYKYKSNKDNKIRKEATDEEAEKEEDAKYELNPCRLGLQRTQTVHYSPELKKRRVLNRVDSFNELIRPVPLSRDALISREIDPHAPRLNQIASLSAKLGDNVLIAIKEFVDEMDTMNSAILQQANEFIQPNEVIMSYGYSRTVISFFQVCFFLGDFCV